MNQHPRSKRNNGPVMIDNINIQVTSKGIGGKMVPSEREMRVKMNLSKDNSDYTLGGDMLGFTNRDGSYLAVHTLGDSRLEHYNSRGHQIDLIQKQSSYYSQHSALRVEQKEEGQQCDLDRFADTQSRLVKSPHMTYGGDQTQQTFNDKKMSHYYSLMKFQKQNQLPSSKPDYTKVRMTTALHRQHQNRSFASVSDNIRPKSQSILTKLTRQKDLQLEKQMLRQENMRKQQSLRTQFGIEYNKAMEQEKAYDQQIGVNKKEIFSRKQVREDFRQRRDDMQYTYQDSTLNQDLIGSHVMRSGFTGTLEQQQADLQSTGNIKSTHMSHQKLEGASDYSYESSRLRKSPYHHYGNYSALKSQYHHFSNRKHSQNELNDNNAYIPLHESFTLKPSTRPFQIPSRNMSVEMKRRRFIKIEENTRNATMNSFTMEASVIPDFRQTQSQLQKKRQNSKDVQQQAIFIPSSKKGVGLQKECALSQIVNNKSCLAQKLYKTSIDYQLRIKHEQWVADKQDFDVRNFSLDPTLKQHGLDSTSQTNQINLQNISQIIDQKSSNHEWTPKSSIVIEFQDPAKQQRKSNHQSYNSQQQSQTLVSKEKKEVIYSFNKGTGDRNSAGKMSRGQSYFRQSKDSRKSAQGSVRRSQDFDYARHQLKSMNIQRLNNDSGYFSIHDSLNINKPLQNLKPKSRASNSQQNRSAEQDPAQMSKQIYPNAATINHSHNSIDHTFLNNSLEGSRENIEEAKDINITQISIKVDQKKTASIDHIVTIEKSHSRQSRHTYQSSPNKSIEVWGNETVSGKKLSNKLKKPPQISDKQFNSDQDHKYVLSNNTSRNLKLSAQFEYQTAKHLNSQQRKIIVDFHNKRFVNRAKSAQSKNRHLQKNLLGIDYTDKAAQRRSDAEKQVNSGQTNSPKLRQNNSNNSKVLSPMQSTKNRINIQKVNQLMEHKDIVHKQFLNENSAKESQDQNTFQQQFIIKDRAFSFEKRKNSKNVISKLQGVSLGNNSANDTLRSQHSNTRRAFNKTFMKIRTQTLNSKSREIDDQNVSVKAGEKGLDDDNNGRDGESNMTEELKKSILTINDEESTLQKKSYKDSTMEDPLERKAVQYAQPAIIQRLKSGIESNEISSNHHSRTMLKTTYDKPFQPSNQEAQTKRTVLMKHKAQHEVSSLNVQTGEYSNGNKYGQRSQVATVEFLIKDDLNMSDLNMRDILDPSTVVRQRKVTDLPKHSLAAPSVHKKNYEMLQQMRKAPDAVLGATKYSSFNMMQPLTKSGSKLERLRETAHTQMSRNTTNHNYTLAKNNSAMDHSDLMINSTQLRTNYQISTQPFEDTMNLDLDIQKTSLQQYQNVQIPMAHYMTSNSQFSTIKNHLSKNTLSKPLNNDESINFPNPSPLSTAQPGSRKDHSHPRRASDFEYKKSMNSFTQDKTTFNLNQSTDKFDSCFPIEESAYRHSSGIIQKATKVNRSQQQSQQRIINNRKIISNRSHVKNLGRHSSDMHSSQNINPNVMQAEFSIVGKHLTDKSQVVRNQEIQM